MEADQRVGPGARAAEPRPLAEQPAAVESRGLRAVDVEVRAGAAGTLEARAEEAQAAGKVEARAAGASMG